MIGFRCYECSTTRHVDLDPEAKIGTTAMISCPKGQHLCMKGVSGWVMYPLEAAPSPEEDAVYEDPSYYVLWEAKNGKKYPDASISVDEAEEAIAEGKKVRTDGGVTIKPVNYQVITKDEFAALIDK